jgi:hypothetical protein
MHCRESLTVIQAVGGQGDASRRLEHPPQFAQRCALIGDQEKYVVSLLRSYDASGTGSRSA